jgi:RNA polymerase sigma-32 factor
MSQRMGSRDTSLDVELTEGEGYTMLNTLADKRDNQEDLLLAKEEQQLNTERTSTALAVLKPRERRIIEQRVLADSPSTLQNLADEFGISRERIRQIEQNALRKLHKMMSEQPPVN